MYLQMKRAALLQWALKKNKSAYSESLWSGWNPPITWKSPSEEKNLESDRVILTLTHKIHLYKVKWTCKSLNPPSQIRGICTIKDHLKYVCLPGLFLLTIYKLKQDVMKPNLITA